MKQIIKILMFSMCFAGTNLKANPIKKIIISNTENVKDVSQNNFKQISTISAGSLLCGLLGPKLLATLIPEKAYEHICKAIHAILYHHCDSNADQYMDMFVPINPRRAMNITGSIGGAMIGGLIGYFLYSKYLKPKKTQKINDEKELMRQTIQLHFL